MLSPCALELATELKLSEVISGEIVPQRLIDKMLRTAIEAEAKVTGSHVTVQQGWFSCLIADMRMPKMTGLELHQYLVASNRAIPTILITAYPDERTQAQAVRDQVVGYLIKPLAADELLARVRRAVKIQE